MISYIIWFLFAIINLPWVIEYYQGERELRILNVVAFYLNVISFFGFGFYDLFFRD